MKSSPVLYIDVKLLCRFAEPADELADWEYDELQEVVDARHKDWECVYGYESSDEGDNCYRECFDTEKAVSDWGNEVVEEVVDGYQCSQRI